MKPINIVVGIYEGCVDSVQLFVNKDKAEKAKAELQKKLGIQAGREEESNNSVETFLKFQ